MIRRLLTVFLPIIIAINMIPGNAYAKSHVNLRPTSSNVLWLAKAICAENGDSTSKTIELTGIVICQRVRAESYPDTIIGVISQKGQYSTWSNQSIQRCKPNKRCMKIAKKILKRGLYFRHPHNLVFQSQFKQGKKIYRYIKKDNEYFCLA